MITISVCIPTRNRAEYLGNCLASIAASNAAYGIDFEVCVSDNGSEDGTGEVVGRFMSKMSLAYERQPHNIGIPRNFLHVVGMASGDFVWLIGDDDLLMPNAIRTVADVLAKRPTVDFVFVNSWIGDASLGSVSMEQVEISGLLREMKPFSRTSKHGSLPFWDLVDPDVSWDFLGGMYLSVFRRERWQAHVDELSSSALDDERLFSHLDNTFPHVKIFAKAFAGTQAFCITEPLSINLGGAREWRPLYPLIRSVRLVEAVEAYRAAGMLFWRYVRCKNYALSYLLPDLAHIVALGKEGGAEYIQPGRIILHNLIYPNAWLSVVYYLGRSMRRIAARLKRALAGTRMARS